MGVILVVSKALGREIVELVIIPLNSRDSNYLVHKCSASNVPFIFVRALIARMWFSPFYMNCFVDRTLEMRKTSSVYLDSYSLWALFCYSIITYTLTILIQRLMLVQLLCCLCVSKANTRRFARVSTVSSGQWKCCRRAGQWKCTTEPSGQWRTPQPTPPPAAPAQNL